MARRLIQVSFPLAGSPDSRTHVPTMLTVRGSYSAQAFAKELESAAADDPVLLWWSEFLRINGSGPSTLPGTVPTEHLKLLATDPPVITVKLFKYVAEQATEQESKPATYECGNTCWYATFDLTGAPSSDTFKVTARIDVTGQLEQEADNLQHDPNSPPGPICCTPEFNRGPRTESTAAVAAATSANSRVRPDRRTIGCRIEPPDAHIRKVSVVIYRTRSGTPSFKLSTKGNPPEATGDPQLVLTSLGNPPLALIWAIVEAQVAPGAYQAEVPLPADLEDSQFDGDPYYYRSCALNENGTVYKILQAGVLTRPTS